MRISVELEEGVWLAPWDGDPGRTLVKDNARQFESKMIANYALCNAKDFRPFPEGKVIEE